MIAAEVGKGWFADTLGFGGGTRFNYDGKELSLFAQLEISHDPNEQPWRLVTDDSWECTPSPVISSELYNGEIYDHRLDCDDQPGYSRTDSVMVADAYLVHVTSLFAKVCRLLNKLDLADKYHAEVLHLRSLFQDRYITPAGNLMANTQTGIALAVCFSLHRDGEKESREVNAAAKALSRLVRAAQYKIGTEFSGTPLITHALTQTAQPQLAYRMLCEKSCPSWMYPVTMGATTVWERWNSMLPDGSIKPGHMTSFNRYALGAVAD
ncbi:hypothetical protein BFJ72_g517 [Fusarium proliferatum]|uniref:alpha-L-rhamnosidase n=1 Tax=Gibberella intermedia TaxID=948311 RepID=A0A420UBD6_GIBIN|nr:hypothetical protein BFJ72_g517 [Fusarium proliferatum]